MTLTLLILLEVFLVLILLLILGGGLLYFRDSWQSTKPGRTVYAGSSLREIELPLEEIIKKYLGEKNTSKYYCVEIGAGLARVAARLSQKHPWKKVSAIEVAPTIWFLAALRKMIYRSNVDLYRMNIFDYTYQSPSFIYSYLFSDCLDRLLSEGKLKDSLVVSLTFPLTDQSPTETIELNNWQKKLYIYDLRESSDPTVIF